MCGSWQTNFSKNNGYCTGVGEKKKKKKKLPPSHSCASPWIPQPHLLSVLYVAALFLPVYQFSSCVEVDDIILGKNKEKNYTSSRSVRTMMLAGHGCFEGKRDGLERKIKKITTEVREQRR